MATAAQKLAQAQDSNVTPVPSCTVKLGKEKFAGSAALGRLVQEGFDLKQELDNLKAKLDVISSKISDQMRDGYLDGVGTVHVEAGGVKATVAVRENVVVSDADGLIEVLGERFPDLVTAKTTYKPERKLIEMACDGDSEERELIGACLSVKEAKPSVTYKVA